MAQVHVEPRGEAATKLFGGPPSPGFSEDGPRLRRSVTGKKTLTAWTELVSRSTGSLASIGPGPPRVARRRLRCPPALPPVTPMRSGSIP
jgi:hypothetical protein